mmetsp:Transcript_40437/g.120645  ORF Transcript_40437/g.120645 Transcript_40437/m.120645 type:complete len:214 (-) Transcript_40437:819-1460(-)
MLVELALGDELFLERGIGAETPAAGVRVALHDDALDLGHAAVVDGRHDGRRHLRDADRDRLSLGRHDDDLVVDVDAALKAQQTRNHELGAKADGVDGRVLDHDTLEACQKHLQRHDHSTKVGLVLEVVVHPLCIQQVMHRHHVVALAEDARAHAAQLLHVAAHAQQQAEVHAERPHVRAGLTADPEDSEVAVLVILVQLGLVDVADAQLALDG